MKETSSTNLIKQSDIEIETVNYEISKTDSDVFIETKPDVYTKKSVVKPEGSVAAIVKSVSGLENSDVVQFEKEVFKTFQFLGTIIVSLGGFMIGNMIGWSSPAQRLLLETKEITKDEYSWISSISAAGGAISQCWNLLLIDRIGRKWTIIYLSFPAFITWVALAFANSFITLFIARFLLGLFVGGMYVVCPTYISEISHASVKGMLIVFFHFYLVLGILYTYVFGLFINNMYWTTFSPAIVPIIFMLLIVFIPKSPVYLLQHGQEFEARAALVIFRGKQFDVDKEIMRILEMEPPEKCAFFKAFKYRSFRKSFFMLLIVSIIQQFSGYTSFIFYSQYILEMSETKIRTNISCLVIAIAQVVIIPIVFLTFGKYSRKLLWYISLSTMCFSLIVLGLFFTIKASYPIKGLMDWIPTLTLSVYVSGYSLGCGPLIIITVMELVPLHIMQSTSIAVAMFNWILIFVVTRTFESLCTILGMHVLIFVHALICGLGDLIILLFIIDTKNKTMDQIEIELNKKSIFTI